jgi:diguanylate cyclase (GGDEF)-like protein
MAPLGEHLVGYLSMFLQLGVLTLLTGLAVLVRVSLGRKPLDGWTLGLALNACAIGVLAFSALVKEAGLLPAVPGSTLAYAALEDLGAVAFIAAIRRRRGVRPVPGAVLVAFALAVSATGAASLDTEFFDAYRVHSACLAALLATAAAELLRAQVRGLGTRLLTVALVLLAVDYLHVPLLTLAGVGFPASYLGLESYVTVVLDIALGVALVVYATDRARVELERRNDALAQAQRALHDTAYTDALCGIPNRAAFLERLENTPRSGCVAMIDLDELKTINDCLGHAAGDLALASVSRCLRERCGPAGIVYRIGGDEFAGIWSGVDAAAVRLRLLASDGDLAVLAEDVGMPVRITWGVAAFGGEIAFADALIAADSELYAFRESRRG